MPKFTPGEWEAEKIYDASWVVFAKDLPVAECNSNEANARLIAAAPEMYRYLRLMVSYVNDIVDDPEDIRVRPIEEVYALLARIDGKEDNHD